MSANGKIFLSVNPDAECRLLGFSKRGPYLDFGERPRGLLEFLGAGAGLMVWRLGFRVLGWVKLPSRKKRGLRDSTFSVAHDTTQVPHS